MAHGEKTPSKDSPAAAVAIGLGILAFLLGFQAIGEHTQQRPIAEVLAERDSTTVQIPNTGATNWQEVAAVVLPSVVSLLVVGEEGDKGLASTGSGVILDENGTIATNNHVVQLAGKGGEVTVTRHDSTVHKAKVVGTDAITDLAIVKLVDPPAGLTPILLGGKPQVGEKVMAVGSPLGLRGSVSEGIISAVDRPITPGQDAPPGTSIVNGLQTDAAINQGNSGGALVNAKGELIGINSAIATDGSGTGFIGIGFSIPVEVMKKINAFLEKGEDFPHGRLGVMVGTSSVEQAGEMAMGAGVAGVEPNSPAEEAGLKKEDVILAIDNVRVVGQEQIVGIVNTYEAGAEVKVSYVRKGKLRTATVIIGERVDPK